MEKFLIEKIQQSEIDEVAEILTDAFETNPAYSIIFKKEGQLRSGLFWLFSASLLINNDKEPLTNVIREKDTGKITGTFTLIPPQGVKKGFSVYLKTGGVPDFISRFGINPLIRMLSLDSCNKESLAKSMKVSEYYYLSMVAIREEYRGMGGTGSFAIKQTVQELTASKPACNLMGLTTQLPENVTFYSRLGFEKLDEGYIDFKGDSYYNYNMGLKIH